VARKVESGVIPLLDADPVRGPGRERVLGRVDRERAHGLVVREHEHRLTRREVPQAYSRVHVARDHL